MILTLSIAAALAYWLGYRRGRQREQSAWKLKFAMVRALREMV